MYTDEVGPSLSKKEHKFFERHLTCDLQELSSFLLNKYKVIEESDLKNVFNIASTSAFDETKSISTAKYYAYNVFQFHNTNIHDLFKNIKSMVLEACDYYGIDFEKERFMVQGWFNINHKQIGKLSWHDHPGKGAPFFHGYYCVNAEPSETHYKLFDEDSNKFTNINKNNRAVLSETGHPHTMGDWDWDGPRITIAYDVVPLINVHPAWEQHWIPLV
jgi:hypothetical protein